MKIHQTTYIAAYITFNACANLANYRNTMCQCLCYYIWGVVHH